MFVKNMHPNHKISYVRIPSDIPATTLTVTLDDIEVELELRQACVLPCTLGQAIWYYRMA